MSASLSLAADKADSDDWMQHYYQQPSPERFEEEVRKLQQAGALSRPAALPPLAGFFGRLFAANPGKLYGWLSVVDSFPENDRRVFMVALKWAGVPAAENLLKQYAAQSGGLSGFCKQQLASPPKDLKRLRQPSAEDLDACWGSFFGSGDKGYAMTVIRCAAAPGEKDMVMMNREAARWSLRGLCRVHPAIVAVKDEFYRSASPEERKSLDELFAK